MNSKAFYNFRRRALLAVLLLALATIGASGRAQQQQEGTRNRRSIKPAPQKSEQAKAAGELARRREEFVKVSKEYKASLEQLLALYEGNVRKAEEQLLRLKELYAAGLISRRDLEASEQSVAREQARAGEVRQQIVTADTQIAETLVEAEAAEQMAQAPPVPRGKLLITTAYMRYNGQGAWALSEAWKVQRFFQEQFGRQLPVSAFGQSAVHDRWRFDHRQAMDVPLNPDGIEGQALINFLRGHGIPFSAFRMAIPGAATGPHIHVGRPSHKF
ncbi:MAG: hypothetical protein ACR2G4_04590 [Pyrinomonadaceae bacterium]